MIFPRSLENRLGVDTVRERIKSYCVSEGGATRVDHMVFSANPDKVRLLLRQNLEFRLLLDKGEQFPSNAFFDGDEWLSTVGMEGGYLDAEEFLRMSQALETAVACKNFLSESRDHYRELAALADRVDITRHIPDLINSKIDDKGMVRDNASPELGRVRRKLRSEQASLRKLADQLFRKAVEEKLVPDGALPTIREGRVVIPILAEHKRRLKGFILDESATGQTVFMEPTEMLETNNEIRELEHAEKREVIAILRSLTDSMREHLPTLSATFAFLGELDFIRAKAKFSREIGAEMPVVLDKPELTWYQARHPLLQLSFARLPEKRDVVPLDITLDPSNRMLLVSGPNAGGKSVCLKTVGLLQYMVQCGLLVPLSERSRVGLFQDLFLDIGDQQSIENDLSTYSSHLRNMAVFIERAGERSLVLMDELGSGTDPNFGGAIAQAVLEALLTKGVWGIATTHYYNLKLYAGERPGIVNAAMRFDEKNLQPLYILEIGKPGSSFALQIARKTGLPGKTIQLAEELVGKDLAGFEKLVRSLEREKQELQEKLRRIQSREEELKQTLAKYKTLSAELEERRREIIGKAKEEAAALLKETNREIEKTIRHIRENRAERKETLKVRKGLEALNEKVVQRTRVPNAVVPGPIREGDRVRITGQQGSGVVLAIKGKSAMVQFGEIKSQVGLDRLEKMAGTTDQKPAPGRPSRGVDLNEKRAQFSPVLDVRGKRVEEVVPNLDQYLDTAILLGQAEIRILHGKGEGVLRKVVRDHLKKYRQVASVADEHVERGGDGITVVVLK